jgi:hypothetical protein
MLQWKNKSYCLFWEPVCSLRNTACNGRVPFCHLWPARLYNIFPLCLKIGTIFKKKRLLNIKFVFWFCSRNFYKIFIILGRMERGIVKSINWFSCKVPATNLVRFSWKLTFLESISKIHKYKNFMNILVVGAELFHTDGQTNRDRHGKTNSHFLPFCECA